MSPSSTPSLSTPAQAELDSLLEQLYFYNDSERSAISGAMGRLCRSVRTMQRAQTATQEIAETVLQELRKLDCKGAINTLKTQWMVRCKESSPEETVAWLAKGILGLPAICPLTKAGSGLISLTLISNYTSVKEGKPRGAVYKWVRQHEVASFQLYKKLAAPGADGRSYGFCLPETEALGVTEMEEVLDQLKMPADTTKGLRGDAEAVLAMEKVPGSAAGDFIAEKYEELVANKTHEKLFLRMGRLALFDLLMGNCDRLLKPALQADGTYQLDDMASALGNVMVRYDGHNFLLYLIDNEIEPTLAQQGYCDFLSDLGSAKELAGHVCESLRNALEAYKEEYPIAAKAAAKSLAQFAGDLEDIGLEQLTLGIDQMAQYIPSMVQRLNATDKVEALLVERLNSFKRII